MAALSRLIRRLAANRSGASAAELAMAMPVLAMMLMATWDLSRGFSARLDLVEAAGRGAELATAYGGVRTDYSALRTEAINAATASGISNPTATVDAWLECDGQRQAAGTMLCPQGAAFARYVSVRASGAYIPLFNIGGMIAGSGFPITGTATVRIQ
jgi:Flp pilus assembly protein TadG